MKKKVRKALKEVRKSMVFGKVKMDDLETLVKWAEKQDAKTRPLKAGDRVELVLGYIGHTFTGKGAQGVIKSVSEHDTLYPYGVVFDGDNRTRFKGDAIGFNEKELRRVSA